MTGTIFLGKCVFEPRPFTRVEPVAIAEDGAWRIYSDWRETLPDEGRVFSPRSPGFALGDFFAFGVEYNDRQDSNGPDRYVIALPTRLDQVLDFRDVTSEHARRVLVEKGLQYLAPGTNRIVVALEGGRCVVLPMARHPATRQYVATLAGLDSIPVHVFDTTVFDGDKIDGYYFAIPNVTVGKQTGTLDWRPDSDFLEAVVKRLRKAAQSSNPFPATRAQASSIITYMTRASLLPAAGEDLTPMKARLASLGSTLSINLEIVTELVDLVCELRPVSERLATELAARRAELEKSLRSDLEATIRRQLDEEMLAENARRDQLRSEADDIGAQVAERKRTLSGVEEAVRTLQEILREEVTILKGSLEDLPPSSADQVRELSGRIAERLAPLGQKIELEPGESGPWARAASLRTTLRPWADAAELFKTAAKRWGYQFEDLVCADMAARAGEVVLLPREAASEFCACYATIVAHGQFARHILDPAVLSLNDLWRPPPRAAPTAFAMAWTAAVSDPRHFQVVLLDGLERTPVDLWASTLIDELSMPRRPNNLLVFCSLGDKPVDRDRIPEGLQDLVFPIFPQRAHGISAEVLSRLSGQSTGRTALDAMTVPRPNRSELLSALDDFQGDPNESHLGLMMKWFTAAWPWSSDIDPSAAALAALRVPPPNSIAPVIFPVSQEGRTWLAKLLAETSTL